MPRFSDSNIESDAIIGKGIDLEELFDRRIVIEKIKIEPTKFPGKNASGMRMQMQVVINAEFMDTPDSDGDFFKKDANGKAIGTRRSVFTGSDNLMSEMKQVQSQWKTERVSQGLPAVDFVVFDTTIAKVGKMFHFTIMTSNIHSTIVPILARYMMTAFGACFAIIKPTFPFIFVCTLAVLADCYTAWSLSRRVKKRFPGANDGKFKSNYAGRVFRTLIKVYALTVLVHLMDVMVFPEVSLHLPQIVAGAVCFWQVWSMLENESSCNDAKWAIIAQRIMVDKTERHFDIDLHELKEHKPTPPMDGVPCANTFCVFRGGGSCDPPKCELYVKPKTNDNGGH